MNHHPPDQPKPIRPQVHYSTSFDTALPEWQQPVTYSEASNGVAAFCHVWITKDLHVSVGTAAEAQEFETRFAAARMYLTDEPVPTPVTDGEVACGVRDDMHYHCTLPIGHAGDHIAHGDRRVRGQLEHYVISAWPQPFDEFHEYPAPPADLDDAGDDITDALVPDVVPDPTVTAATGAVPAVAAADAPADLPHAECTVGARPGFARNPTTFKFEPTVVTP